MSALPPPPPPPDRERFGAGDVWSVPRVMMLTLILVGIVTGVIYLIGGAPAVRRAWYDPPSQTITRQTRDGRTVECVVIDRGVSCDWEHAK